MFLASPCRTENSPQSLRAEDSDQSSTSIPDPIPPAKRLKTDVEATASSSDVKVHSTASNTWVELCAELSLAKIHSFCPILDVWQWCRHKWTQVIMRKSHFNIAIGGDDITVNQKCHLVTKPSAI